MEALNEQQYPLVKLVLELALELELARVQALQVQALVRVQLEPLVQAQLEQERPLQRNHPKPQLHRHRCKVPDRIREPQQAHCQTQAHPKALDTTTQ